MAQQQSITKKKIVNNERSDTDSDELELNEITGAIRKVKKWSGENEQVDVKDEKKKDVLDFNNIKEVESILYKLDLKNGDEGNTIETNL